MEASRRTQGDTYFPPHHPMGDRGARSGQPTRPIDAAQPGHLRQVGERGPRARCHRLQLSADGLDGRCGRDLPDRAGDLGDSATSGLSPGRR
jgi:hypothetical protein